VSRRDERVSPRPVPVLRSSRVTLRPPLPRDAGAARRIGLYPENLRMFGEETDEAWRELTRAESEELLEALAPTEERVTWVADAGEGFIGTASLHSFSADGTTAAYAIGLLSPDVLGHGLGTEVTRLVLAHAFVELSLHQLTVRVLEFNSRAIGCYVRCGFTDLRREPDAVTLGGVPYADEIMHLEAARYRELAAAWEAGADVPGV
jgi:RimJ/RimL family protein N-acetyltransferase